jgi:hypothetical protein
MRLGMAGPVTPLNIEFDGGPGATPEPPPGRREWVKSAKPLVLVLHSISIF